MNRRFQALCQSLLALSLLAGCGQVTHSSPGTIAYQYQPVTLSQLNNRAMTGNQQSQYIQYKPQEIEQPQKIDLKQVSQKIVETQAKLIKALDQKTSPNSEEQNLSKQEVTQIRQWITDLKDDIQQEDLEFNANSPQNFSIKTADGGKDVDIEMFLYHPTYGKRAKFWGIDSAHDFLMAGRSPFRRWLLKKKLEGFFAPKGFDQQILFWVEQADLMRISGVSREDAFLLVAQGITSVPDLARRNSIELGVMRVSMALMAFNYGFDAPKASELQAWATEAKSLEVVIY